MIMQLNVLVKKQRKLYSAVCLELDVASQGKTPKEAEENLKEAVLLYLESINSKDIKAIRRPAPYKIWQEYYKVKTACLMQEVKKSHHPKIDLHGFCAA